MTKKPYLRNKPWKLWRILRDLLYMENSEYITRVSNVVILHTNRYVILGAVQNRATLEQYLEELRDGEYIDNFETRQGNIIVWLPAADLARRLGFNVYDVSLQPPKNIDIDSVELETVSYAKES